MTENERQAALCNFVRTALNGQEFDLISASNDASFRSYQRVNVADRSMIVMNAPPDKEDIKPWLDIAQRLRRAGLNAPEIHAADEVQGFILMTDLGSDSYLSQLTLQSVGSLYDVALSAIVQMQTQVDVQGLPLYDELRLMNELELFPTWFLQRHLGLSLNCAQWDTLETCFRHLIDNATEQPQAFVHRDYHSRNLMVTANQNPGIIDFQDAVVGPITYDVVSLLRDCYIAWPQSLLHNWLQQQHQRSLDAGLTEVDFETYQRWFDWMGLQRHIKVLGIFCRLWYRDGKASYLHDLPLVLQYTIALASRYAETQGLAQWLVELTQDLDITRARA